LRHSNAQQDSATSEDQHASEDYYENEYEPSESESDKNSKHWSRGRGGSGGDHHKGSAERGGKGRTSAPLGDLRHELVKMKDSKSKHDPKKDEHDFKCAGERQ
jgi:hypothetical protein